MLLNDIIAPVSRAFRRRAARATHKASRRRSARSFRPVVEPLEPRLLLAYTVPNDYLIIGGATPDPTTSSFRNVTSGGVPVQLQAGQDYIAIATGVVRIANDGRLADAQYAQAYATAPAWTHLSANSPFAFDGTTNAWTGGNPSAGDHRFGKTISPTSSFTARVKFNDNQYNDNGYAESVFGYTASDRLQVKLYQQIKLLSLTATENGNATNTVIDTGGSAEDLYVPTDENGQAKVDLSVALNLPTPAAEAKVLWSVDGNLIASTPNSHTFATFPTLTLGADDDDVAVVHAGVDVNGNGTLDAGEPTRAVNVHLVPLVTIESARGSGVSVGAVREGDSGVAGFTLKRSLATNEALSVTIAVDVSSPAAQGVASLYDDYILQDDEGNEYDVMSGTFVVTWAASDDSLAKTVYLAARIDNLVEGDETAIATLPASVAPHTYAVGASSSADATIEDDPPVVTVSLSQNGSEDPDADGTTSSPKPVRFLLTRTGGDINSPVTVTFTVMGTGTHAADINDYVNEDSADVYESATVELAVVDDDEVEFREEITLDLDDSSSGFTVGEDSGAVAKISDNDFAITAFTVAFDDQGVKRDSTGVKYDPKQWNDSDGDGESDVHGENVSTPTHGFPISYRRSLPGDPTKIGAAAGVKITLKDPNVLAGEFKILGDADYPNGVSLFSGTTAFGTPVAEADGSIVITVTGTTTCDTDLPGTIDYADLRVTWTLEREVVVDGDSVTQSESAGTSRNMLYVTGAAAADAYETVLDLGCRGAAGKRPGNAGELAEDLNANGVLDSGEDTNGNGVLDDEAGIANRDVADAIFGIFSGKNAAGGLQTKRVDGTVMVYDPNMMGRTATELLSDPHGRGQCAAWADLLHETFAAQGIVSEKFVTAFGDPHTFQFKVAEGNVQGGVHLANPRTEFAYHVLVKIASNPNRIYDATFAVATDKDTATSVEERWEAAHVLDLFDPNPSVRWYGSNPVGQQLTWVEWSKVAP